MDGKDTAFIVAFRTGQLYEIDMAADALNPSQEPDVWGFEPSPHVKLGWKVFVVSLLVIPILMLLVEKLLK